MSTLAQLRAEVERRRLKELLRSGGPRETAGRYFTDEYQDAQRQRRMQEEKLKSMQSQRQMSETALQEQLRQAASADDLRERQFALQEEAGERAGALGDVQLQAQKQTLGFEAQKASREAAQRKAAERAGKRVRELYSTEATTEDVTGRTGYTPIGPGDVGVTEPGRYTPVTPAATRRMPTTTRRTPTQEDIERIYFEEGADLPLEWLTEQRKRKLPFQQKELVDIKETGATKRTLLGIRKQEAQILADIKRDARKAESAEELEVLKYTHRELLAKDRRAEAYLDRQIRAKNLGIDSKKLKLAEKKYLLEATKVKLLKDKKRPEDAAIKQVLKRADAQAKINESSPFDESIDAAAALYGHDSKTFKIINGNLKKYMKASGLSDNAVARIYIDHGYDPETFEIIERIPVIPRSQQISQGLTGGRAPIGNAFEPRKKGRYDIQTGELIYD
jgi:hypothetical protein